MRPQRLFTLGILTVGCLTGAAAAQSYPSNPYSATNPYSYYPQSTSAYYSPGYAGSGYQPSPYGAAPYGPAAYGTSPYGASGYGAYPYGAYSYGASGYGTPGYGASGYGASGYGAPYYGASPYGYGASGYPAYGAPAAPGYYPANGPTTPSGPGVARPLPTAPGTAGPEPTLVTPDHLRGSAVVDTLPATDPVGRQRDRFQHGRGFEGLEPGCGCQSGGLLGGYLPWGGGSGCGNGCANGGCGNGGCPPIGCDVGLGCPGECNGRDGARAWSAACERACGDLHRCYFDVSAVILRPMWHDNPAFVNGALPTGAGGGAPIRSGFTDFDYNWTVTPRLEVGFQGKGGFGIRGRYMYFDAITSTCACSSTDNTITTASPLGLAQLLTPGILGTAHSRLNFHLADIEGMQEWRWGPYWQLRVSGGARAAYLQQNYDFDDAEGTTLNSFSHFSGGGPTSALELRRNFPNCHLTAYTIGRGSLLVGRSEQRVSATSGGFLTNFAVRSEDDILPMGELEAGLEWSCFVGKCRIFVSAGAFSQLWLGVGNSSDSSSTIQDSNALSRRDLLLIGGALTLGFDF